jgi:pyridinium-3,5-bisthiocarboxylic acid mononucleotide nickel chelatase
MKRAHFDCFSGISGDMTLGALIDAGVPESRLRSAIASLNLPVELEVERVKRCGFTGIKVTVHAKDEEEYRFLPDVLQILERGELSPAERTLAETIFRKVAIAEATVHGMPLERVHFHEVGALDSIVDIVGVSVGVIALGVDSFTASPVPTGRGTVKCAHGIMPVPTPGTLELLKGVPLATSTISAELTTPTGAAIVTSLATEYTATPRMTVERIGTGCGTKDFLEQPNILRLFVGHTASQDPTPTQVVVLETNIDDCTSEVLGYTIEQLFAAGALDVYTIPIQMKKHRPGVILCVMTTELVRSSLEAIIIRETGTFGIRRMIAERTIVTRTKHTIETTWGPVTVKQGQWNADSILTPEYADCARIAQANNLPLRVVYDAVLQAARSVKTA